MDTENASKERTFDFVGGRLCLDFTDTAGSLRTDSPSEYIESYADLLAWARQAGAIPENDAAGLTALAGRKPKEAEAVRLRAVELRRTLWRIFFAVAEDKEPGIADMKAFNNELSAAMSHARIERSGDGEFSWAWEGQGSGLDGMLWPVLRSAADLLTAGELERVKVCSNDTCGWLFLDTTRNHSRQWCDMNDCGNRAKARRHYEKKKAMSQK